ncbi:unnamed protein product [Rhizophagus irregularis]|nr:unnamed protein product [Rhizophagus irregularis]
MYKLERQLTAERKNAAARIQHQAMVTRANLASEQRKADRAQDLNNIEDYKIKDAAYIGTTLKYRAKRQDEMGRLLDLTNMFHDGLSTYRRRMAHYHKTTSRMRHVYKTSKIN